jgi:hypothetical protein
MFSILRQPGCRLIPKFPQVSFITKSERYIEIFEREGNMKKSNLWILVVLILVLSACSSDVTITPVKPCADIISDEGVIKYDYLTISGTVKNVCDHTISYVKLEGFAYNDAGTQDGYDWNYADSDKLPPGAESEFTIMIKVPSDSTQYKVRVMDWY